MDIIKWVESTTTKYARPVYLMALLLLALAGAAVIGDYFVQASAAVSPRLLRKVGKGLGGLSANLAAGALGYYLLREVFVRLLPKAQASSFAWGLPYLKTAVSALRLLHPALGVAAIALALSHGYLMWLAAGGLGGGLAVVSGLTLAGGAAVLASLGGLVLALRPGLTVRRDHRLAALVVILLYAVHMLGAD